MKRPVSLLNCFLIPILTLLAGIIIGGLYAFRTIPKAYQDDVRAVVPPKFSHQFPEPGRYSLWAYSTATFEDTLYESDTTLPAGAKLHVIDNRTGDFIPVSDWGSQNKSWNDEKARLIGTFETVIPGQQVDFIGSGIKEKIVIGISSKNRADMINLYLAIFAIIIISLFVSITMLVVLLHRRKKAVMAGVQ